MLDLTDDADLARAKALPQCRCCHKQSDAAILVSIGGVHVTLCGTCRDAWRTSAEAQRILAAYQNGDGDGAMPAWTRRAFVEWETRARAERLNG